MRRTFPIACGLVLLCAACTPVIRHAPIKSTPQEAVDCAGGLLGSMGYELLDHDQDLRAERARHAAFGQQRADYDRITVIVSGDEMHVRGETVAMSGGDRAAPMRGSVPRNPGGTTITMPSKELRADVQRIAAECGRT